MLALVSMLLTPPVMAWTLDPMTQMTQMTVGMQSGTTDTAHSLLCPQQSSNQQQSPMPDCPLVACGVIATVDALPVVESVFDIAHPSTLYSSHFGRLVPGPEPQPPRAFHSS